MKRFNWLLCVASVAVATALATPASRAEVDISFGAHAPVGDGNLFFSISSRYFDRDPYVVTDWGRRFRNPDDLAVFFYIVSHSRMTPEAVYGLRSRGLSWYEVGTRCGLPFSSWYVTVGEVPGGRYARPYRYWDRYRQNPHYTARLSDREIRDLVAVRMAHEYYRVSPQTAMDWRRRGDNVQVIMTREYHSRHHDNGRHLGQDRGQSDYDRRDDHRDDHRDDRHDDR